MPLTEIEKQITTEVLNRFLADKKPTARRPLSTKFEDPNALNGLVERSVLRVNSDRSLFLPMVLAFHHCADEAALQRARKSLSVVVRAMQELFRDASVDYPQFTPEEIEARARQSDEEVTADLIRLGLYLAQEFGVLHGWTPSDTEPPEFKSVVAIEVKSVGASDQILTHKNVDGLWDERIRQWKERFEPSERGETGEPNVLLRALRVFCTDAQMLDLLTRPHEVPPKRLGQGAAFELHVGRFLSLLGFSTIILGEYEDIVAKTKVKRGTLDILAAHFPRKLLLVVACTINTPKNEDFGQVRNAREIVFREGLVETEYCVTPVIFTAAMGGSLCNTDGAECVPIVDADLMKEFLELIWEGQEEPLFEFLANPNPEIPRAITGWGSRDDPTIF